MALKVPRSFALGRACFEAVRRSGDGGSQHRAIGGANSVSDSLSYRPNDCRHCCSCSTYSSGAMKYLGWLSLQPALQLCCGFVCAQLKGLRAASQNHVQS